MATRSRTIRLDIAPVIYEALETEAMNIDSGVSDVIRRILVQWMSDNPSDPNSPDLP